MLFLYNFQNKTTEENQRKLSSEMQKIREEMGEWEPTFVQTNETNR